MWLQVLCKLACEVSIHPLHFNGNVKQASPLMPKVGLEMGKRIGIM